MGLGAEIDDFLLHSSGNSLQLCAFATLLVFPGSAGLLVVGGAFLADARLRGRYAWLLPCSAAMLCLGVVLLLVGAIVIVKLCRAHRRQQRLRLQGAAYQTVGSSPHGWLPYRDGCGLIAVNHVAQV